VLFESRQTPNGPVYTEQLVHPFVARTPV
jgi:hypothetical protein